jgi:cytochrome P450
MLRDPRIWGDDADTFKPERFLAEHNPRLNELPDMESLPFGFGRRYAGLYILS